MFGSRASWRILSPLAILLSFSGRLRLLCMIERSVGSISPSRGDARVWQESLRPLCECPGIKSRTCTLVNSFAVGWGAGRTPLGISTASPRHLGSIVIKMLLSGLRKPGWIVIPECDCASYAGLPTGSTRIPVTPVFQRDINNLELLLLHVPCEILTASFQCVSFSTMGNRNGIQSEPGKALLGLVEVVRLIQPLAVVFENVPGFRSSKGFNMFREQLRSAGFVIRFATTHNMSLLSCMERKRWIGVAVNTWFTTPDTPIELWAHPVVRLSTLFSPRIHTSAEWRYSRTKCLTPTQQEVQMLKKFNLMDNAMGMQQITFEKGRFYVRSQLHTGPLWSSLSSSS